MYKKAFLNSLLMMIIGISPIMFIVIEVSLDPEQKYTTVLSTIPFFIGGILCSFYMKEKHNIKLKDYLNKPNGKISLYTILTAFFYTIVVLYVVNRPTLTRSPDGTFLEYLTILLASTLAPIGEELVFRFSMLTLLLIAATNNKKLSYVSIVIISVLWMIVHFTSNPLRMIDIISIGIITGFVYYKTKNILYSIIFHIIANLCTYSSLYVYNWFFKREYILYIDIILLLFSLIMLLKSLNIENENSFSR